MAGPGGVNGVGDGGSAAADAVTMMAAAAATAASRSTYRRDGESLLLVDMEPLLEGSMVGYREALNRNASYSEGTAAFTSV
ncbi:hypothetical protein [Nonomuraea mesophila]|uniref:hypothetical protein n=1 Tax=Nonomuraea mesophila TaxID=2530382 RepID=UPI00140AD517|nr:hypothetical protein [Nonomuraea mesophila]